MDSLVRAFDAARAKSEDRSWIYGQLGTAAGVVAVANRPGFVYVRVSSAASQSLTIARNPYAVPQQANLPVRMKQEGGVLVVYGRDTSALTDAATSGETINPYGVAKHTHMIGTGLDYEVEGERLEPGRLYPAGGLVVGVRSFRYMYGGGWQTFQGDTVSLGANRPSTVGKHRWVLVGVDPATNAIVVENGADYDYATTLSIGLIDAITFNSYIPAGAVKVRNDDTAVTDVTKYQDAHGWFNLPGDVTQSAPWHTHRMSVDTGTRTIAAGYSLVVPWFEIPAGMVLEIAAGGVLMVIG